MANFKLTVFYSTLGGCTLPVNTNTTLREVTVQLEQRLRIPSQEQSLTHFGRALTELDQSLRQLGITQDTTIFVTRRTASGDDVMTRMLNVLRQQPQAMMPPQPNEDDPEYQRRMLEAIEQRNIAENFEQGIEHNPEAFGSVIMLYVPCEVNRVPVPAFIDSGAQMTIMSQRCAEKCNLLRLVDKRFAGMALEERRKF